MSRLKDTKCKKLNEELDLLFDQFEGVSERLLDNLNPEDKPVLQKKLETIEKNIHRVETQMAELGCLDGETVQVSPTTEKKSSPKRRPTRFDDNLINSTQQKDDTSKPSLVEKHVEQNAQQPDIQTEAKKTRFFTFDRNVAILGLIIAILSCIFGFLAIPNLPWLKTPANTNTPTTITPTQAITSTPTAEQTIIPVIGQSLTEENLVNWWASNGFTLSPDESLKDCAEEHATYITNISVPELTQTPGSIEMRDGQPASYFVPLRCDYQNQVELIAFVSNTIPDLAEVQQKIIPGNYVYGFAMEQRQSTGLFYTVIILGYP
jgi:hypothetical protein